MCIYLYTIQFSIFYIREYFLREVVTIDSAPASAFLILKSFKIIPVPLQLGCRVPARVLACLLSDGPVWFGRHKCTAKEVPKTLIINFYVM
jgi:hypothetical protein